MRLFFKYACAVLGAKVRGAQRAILAVAGGEPRTSLIPGYTHLQRAQPVYAAHHLLAWIEMLERDRARLVGGRRQGERVPPGLRRDRGHDPSHRPGIRGEAARVRRPPGAARGSPRTRWMPWRTGTVLIEFASACALFGVHISRIAEDLILWSSAEFRFVALPDAFCTGSSLMPQKKNPDSCELLRGKSARLQGNLHTLLTLVKGLPMTYNRDLQEDKPPVFDSFDQSAICADVLEGTVRGMSFNRARCAAAASDPGAAGDRPGRLPRVARGSPSGRPTTRSAPSWRSPRGRGARSRTCRARR